MVRRYAVLIAVMVSAVMISALGAVAGGLVYAATRTPPAGPASSVALRVPGPPAPVPGAGGPGCERQVARSDRPRLVIVGASFTAGIGSGPGRSWAALLARKLRYDTVLYGDPGVGYVRAGAGRRGPVAGELVRVDLAALAPSLVIVQAGHDDIGVPPGLERQRVTQVIAAIRAEAPKARIALLTVFARRSPSPAAYRTDRTIVAAARAAGPGVIVIDPLAAGWTFPRSRDGLHPDAAGSTWIAGRVAAALRAHGVYGMRPAATRSGTIVCDLGPRPPSPRPSSH